MSARPPKALVIGAGKVGRALRRGLAAAGAPVVMTPARRPLPRSLGDAAVIVIACRDDRIRPIAEAIAEHLRQRDGRRPSVSRARAAVHCAGARDPDELEVLRAEGLAVGQMHPLVSFAHPRRSPTLLGASMLVRGDALAVRQARRIARALGMIPRAVGVAARRRGDGAPFDAAAYHAAASVVANGAAALAALGADLLAASGLDRSMAPAMLGPLLRSVGENIADLGLPEALTGPVRRGDRETLVRHLARIRRVAPESGGLYAELVKGQLELARALGDAPVGALDAIGVWLAEDAREQRKPRG